MGYATQFEGRFDLNRELTDDHQQALADLAEKGFAGAKGMPSSDRGSDVVYCQWRPTNDRRGIEWDRGEKFYKYLEWLQYIIDHYLQPWGYKLNGSVEWSGADSDDQGIIRVTNNCIQAVRYRC